MRKELQKELEKTLRQERDKIAEELKFFAKPDPKMKGDWDANYPKFEAEEYGSHASLDEEANELEEYESSIAAEHSLESRLLETNRALEKMEKGTYGVCAKCRKEINEERLKANPAAEFCVEHSPKSV